jgi:hypothetical protein
MNASFICVGITMAAGAILTRRFQGGLATEPRRRALRCALVSCAYGGYLPENEHHDPLD